MGWVGKTNGEMCSEIGTFTMPAPPPWTTIVPANWPAPGEAPGWTVSHTWRVIPEGKWITKAFWPASNVASGRAASVGMLLRVSVHWAS